MMCLQTLALLRREMTVLVNTPCLKNVLPLACYNIDTHEWILIFFWQKCYR